MALKSDWVDSDYYTSTAANDVANAINLVSVSAQTDNYTLVLTDAGKVVEVTKATAVNVTVPTNASVAFPIGTPMEVVQMGAGQVTLVAAGGVTLLYPASLKTRARYSVLSLRKQATNTWIVGGDAA